MLKKTVKKTNEANDLLEKRIGERTSVLTKANEALQRENEEHKVVEETLLKNEERFRDLLETTSDWVWEVDENAAYTYASPQVHKILGYRFEEIVGKTPFDLMPPEEAKRVATLFKSIAASQEAFDCLENINLHKDGTPVVLETSGVPFLDAHGKFCGYRGVDRDITKRKNGEEEIKKLSLAIEQSPASIVLTDTEGKIEYVNPKFTEITGYSAEEAAGQNPRILKSGKQSTDFYKELWETITSGKEWHGEFLNKKKNGDMFWENASISPVLNIKGGITNFIAVKEDITKRKQMEEALRISEERYALAIEGSNDGIWDRDLLTGDTYFSPRWKEIIGYLDKELPNHVDEWKKRIHHDDYDMVMRNVGDYLAGITDRYSSEYRMQHKDGSWRWIRAKGAKACGDGGKPTRFAGSHADITEQKKSEEDRKSLEAQLLQAQKLETIGTLVGGIAHDFNNILSPLLICSEIALEETPEDSEMRETIETILKASHRARDLVKQILLFSSSGEQNRETIKMKETVNDAMKLVRSSLPSTVSIEKNIHLNEETISADPIQIHQLIMNLCTNAYHAMQEGGGQMKVELSAIDIDHIKNKLLRLKEEKYIQLSISDNGQGIDELTKQRIFDPFFTTKETGKGTGLGLSVVLGIVMNHDGEITVESEVGKGSTFHVYLPQSGGDKAAALQSGDEIDPRGRENVLFVDDESAISFVGKNALEQLGYKVTACNNPVDALELFRNKPEHFNIVISDYTMPNMTGLQLAKNLKEIRSNIPVIITSGYNDTISEENMSRFDINEYIIKPFAGRDLGRAIRRVLDK